MFKKPKRSNFRSRRKDSDSEEEDNPRKHETGDVDLRIISQSEDGIEAVALGIREITQNDSEKNPEKASMISPVGKLSPNDNTEIKKPSTKPTIVSKLSFFGHEEDSEEEITVKKSSYSKRMTKQLEREKKKREKERREKESKMSNQDTREVNLVDKPEEVILIPNEESDDDQEDDDNLMYRVSSERSSIPDAKTIFALKKQRQSRKHTEEFISLSATVPHEGRLNRNDMDSDDHDEEEEVRGRTRKLDQYDEEFNEDDDERIDFDLRTTQEKERQLVRQAIDNLHDSNNSKMAATNDHSDDDDHEEQEVSRWERDQILKGVSSAGVTNKTKIEAANMMQVSSSPPLMASLEDEDEGNLQIPNFITDVDKNIENVTVDDVLDLIQELIDEKKDKISYLDRQLTSLSTEETMLSTQLETLEQQQKHLDNERSQLHEKLKKVSLQEDEHQ